MGMPYADYTLCQSVSQSLQSLFPYTVASFGLWPCRCLRYRRMCCLHVRIEILITLLKRIQVLWDILFFQVLTT